MASNAPDYYKTLGVSKDADEKEIKKAFRKLAQKHHPDAGGDEEKFKEINEAYEVLSDPQKRQVYDQFGSMGGAAGFNGQNPFAGYAAGQNPFGGGTRVNLNGMEFDIGDIFNGANGWSEILERLRGGQGAWGTDWDFKSNGGQGFGRGPKAGPNPFSRMGRKRSQVQPEENMNSEAELEISFDEAFKGCKKTFQIKVPDKPKPETITLKIPEGTKDGAKMKLKGRGQTIFGGHRADLIVKIKVATDGLFRYENANVVMDLPISITEATLGAKVEIPTPDGKKLRVKIPSGCKNGAKLKINGCGAINRNGNRGKLVAIVNVVIPKKLNNQQKKAMEKYAKVEDKEIRPW